VNHSEFFETNFCKEKIMPTVVIDPGHGGDKNLAGSSWNNAVGTNGSLEKNLTLQVARAIQTRFDGSGTTCLLTRDADTNLGLAARAGVAKAARAEAFVSIHFNGSTKSNAQGTETLVSKNFSRNSAELSLKVQDQLLTATGLNDRNKSFNAATRIKPQSLGVLRPSRHFHDTAACLVEVSFLDRTNEETRLAGIADYTGLVLADAQDAEFGDAIDAMAHEAGKKPEEALGLWDKPSEVVTSDESKEISSPPGAVFSKAFVGGSLNADVLLGDAGDADYLNAFRAFHAALNLRYFAMDEVLELGASNNGNGKCSGKNHYPPQDLWHNIAPTILMLDEIRDQLGAPIRILSGYRSDAYNTCVDGEPASLHKTFQALDFTCSKGSPEVWRRVAKKVMHSNPDYTGGIGLYTARNFLHIDTRGQPANWGS
jgi:N-acetylmuramoyl-L-alanine amidase